MILPPPLEPWSVALARHYGRDRQLRHLTARPDGPHDVAGALARLGA